MRGRSEGVALLLSMCLMLTGCMGLDEATSGMLASTTTPDRVIMKIINNTCDTGDDEEDEDSEEGLSTGQVKGLLKVKDGFGIPYGMDAAEYVSPPVPITDDSYEANKNRGFGYCGNEAHYMGDLKPGETHVDEHMEAGFEDPGCPFDYSLTAEEEQYGCAMRWEYSYDNGLSGNPNIAGYFEFLSGNGSGQWQYVAIHCIETDKWCICCPYDYGPALWCQNQGTRPAAGRIGGTAPAASEALGFYGMGECPETTYCEFWWVENSADVKCGPVDDLSAFTGGGKQKVGKDGGSGGKAQATVHVANDIVDGITRNGSGVQVAPANENSFELDLHADEVTGKIDPKSIKKIIIHELVGVSSDREACYRVQFRISEDGRITKRGDVGQLMKHTNDDSIDKVSVGIGLERSQLDKKPPSAQMNALDRLISYIDQKVGSQADISLHQGELATESAVPIQKYQESRNHSGVVNVEQVSQAAANHECDDEEEDEENPYAGGPGIAREAVDISGTAAPYDPIHGKWDEKPTDERLSRYVSEKERVYSEVPGWADCGRCAATAVKGSGADDTFPADKNTAYQYEYMKSSPKWQQAGVMRPGDAPDAMCKPGDVLVTQGKGHIMIYVGNEAVKEKYPTSAANFFEGSLGDYYGWCYLREVSTESKDYAIFRCIKPDNAGKKGGMSGDRATIVEFARSQIGVPYNDSFAWENDIANQQLTCNGLTRVSYEAAGIEIPASSYEQIEQMPNITSTGSVADLIPGDIVVFDDCNRRPDIGSYPNPGYRHVAIYAGDGEIVEAKVPGTPAGTRALNDGDFSFGGWFGDLGKTMTQKKSKKSKGSKDKDGDDDGSKDKKASGSSKSSRNVKESALGRQLAWLCVQCAATAGDPWTTRIHVVDFYAAWAIPSDPAQAAKLKNLQTIMDADMSKGNKAYGSCCQAACGMIAAVVDPDIYKGSDSPGAMAGYMVDHPEIYKVVNIGSIDELRPGDILNSGDPNGNDGHVAIYVGNDLAQTKFKGTDGNLFEAGFNMQTCDVYYPGISPMDWGIYQSRQFVCYRPIAKAQNPEEPWIDWEKLVDADTNAPRSGEGEEGIDPIDVDKVRVNVNVSRA